jgi:hypothetical protein
MIDRRKLLAVGVAGWAGTAAAGPQLARPASAGLNGVWTNAWYTRLQRPKAFKSLTVTPEDAEAFEAPRRAHHGELLSKEDVIGQNESEFPDNGPGLARIDGQIRSSWIVDPPDGRLPWTEEAKKRLHIGGGLPEVLDNVENRETDERCLTVPGAGPPMTNSHDGNVMTFVQTPQWLAILGEKNHDLRLVRILGPGEPRPAGEADPRLRSWHGESVGHWEGATLVIETQGLRPGVTKIDDDFYLSDRARVTERLTRTGPAEIAYGFEVADASLFTRAWRAEMVFRPEPRGIFEYACHEGNYSLPGILRAARAAEMSGR